MAGGSVSLVATKFGNTMFGLGSWSWQHNCTAMAETLLAERAWLGTMTKISAQVPGLDSEFIGPVKTSNFTLDKPIFAKNEFIKLFH